MAYSSPRAAIDFLARTARAALQCVARAEVLPSGFNPRSPGNLVVVAHEKMPPNTLMLRRPNRTPYLQLKVATEYTVIQHLEAPTRLRFDATVTMYLYAVNNLDGQELFAYHWHPVGLSSVHLPHMHVSSARPVALPVTEARIRTRWS